MIREPFEGTPEVKMGTFVAETVVVTARNVVGCVGIGVVARVVSEASV